MDIQTNRDESAEKQIWGGEDRDKQRDTRGKKRFFRN